MEDKKRVIILVTIALILAATAIALNVMESEETPTSRVSGTEETQGGKVGIDIQPTPVEDKLAEQNSQPQQ